MRLLIVDDESNIRMVLVQLFKQDGYEVDSASNGKEAMEFLKRNQNYGCIISDLKMPIMDGMAFFQESRSIASHIPFVFITAFGSIEDAVFAIKSGAADFISKPFDRDSIRKVVAQFFEGGERKERFSQTENGLVYCSAEIEGLIQKIKKLAKTNLSLCILGESGTGKEGLAKTLHFYHQKQMDEKSPFVSINCPAIPESLIESEVFGYRKGAFSGAERDHIGKIERAQRGTVFFDEIGDLPLAIQPKLLRLLEERSFEPLGGKGPLRTDARFVFATNRNLEEMVRKGSFREDLYYRIQTVTLVNPPLRERPEDIPILAEHFLSQFCRENNCGEIRLHSDCQKSIMEYSWPGNVRELKNTIGAAAAISDSGILFPDDLLPAHKMRHSHKSSLKDSEKEIVKKALNDCNWNISATARRLEISRGSLRYKMEKFKLNEVSTG